MTQISTVVEALKLRAQQNGDGPAFIFRDKDGGRYVQTFGQIHTLGGRYAAVLRAGGSAGRGQLVINTLTNCPERVVCEAAVLMAGAATVNAQCLTADGSDLLGTIRSSRASSLIVDPDVPHSPWRVLEKHVTIDDRGRVVSAPTDLERLKQIYFVRRPDDNSSNENNNNNNEDFLTKLEASPTDWFEAEDVTPDDVCSVFTTSGSTGFSKLVVHTHGGLAEAVLVKNPAIEGLTAELEFSMAPLGWLGGYVGNVLLAGTPRVLCDTRRGVPPDVIGFMLLCFEEENVYATFVPAPRLVPLLDRVKQNMQRGGDERRGEGGRGQRPADSNDPGRSLRILGQITLGGQPITRSLVRMASLLADKVRVIYGITEMFLVTSLLVTDPDSYRDFDTGDVVDGGEVRIVPATVAPEGKKNQEREKTEDVPVPANTVGVILFKRRVMMREYLHDAQATADAFTSDGFFRTGDVGHLDERGHLVVDGRASDAIMRGSYIFYPGWIEERIRACPGVSDVMVVGVPDPAAHEEICACVTLKEAKGVTVQQVQDYVEQDIVTSASEDPLSPRPRHYLMFDSFPVTSTGKPHRKVIQQQATARLSTSSDD